MGSREWVQDRGRAHPGEGPTHLLTPGLQAEGTYLIKSHLGGTLWGPGHMSRGPHRGPVHCRGKHPNHEPLWR